MSKYLVTSALPYANGKLHIGHLAGAYLPADIYVRFLKLCENEVIYVCGTDEHGAPISIRAEVEGKTPQEIVEFYHQNILDSFTAVDIEFDNFSGTARAEHHKLSQEFFTELLSAHKVTTKTTKQAYCEHDNRFLPDRYVEGDCPHCGAAGARGDQCDACGKLIDANLLINPICKICGHTPVIKDTKHWFLDLPAFADELKEWLENKPNWKDNVKRFILSWIEEGLIERAITRDINWGVPVPLEEGADKVLYVWFDAPIGYISSTIEWAKKIGKPDVWKEYWFDENTKLIHFIGKDNIPFHAIIWPAILMGQSKKYVLPWDIPANEYLNLEGDKISTSRDYAVWVEDFVKDFDSDLLRFVLAANAPESKDADFSWKDFQNLVNNSLSNVLGNLANRVFAFAQKNLSATVQRPKEPNRLITQDFIDSVYNDYSEFRVRKVTKAIFDFARDGNKYFNDQEPWVTIKTDISTTQDVIFYCADLLRVISIILFPIMPKSMKRLRMMMKMNETGFGWKDIWQVPEVIEIGEFERLFRKIEDAEIDEQIKRLEGKVKNS
ncbi:MAG: methionine--tRNA ligase [Candidatus Cloacimonetes bacterium]|nr:methionine--tRNA ligase [Candidatus Cloacimonadota bacterium]